MVTVLAPVVEAARLPRVCPMALGYGLPPCNNNNGFQFIGDLFACGAAFRCLTLANLKVTHRISHACS